jgi:hypothetical protein
VIAEIEKRAENTAGVGADTKMEADWMFEEHLDLYFKNIYLWLAFVDLDPFLIL